MIPLRGLALIVLSVMIPIVGYFSYLTLDNAVALISQSLGATALVLMALIQLLATRIQFLESIFGPYDRIYQLHKWLGITVLGVLFLHNFIDASLYDSGWLSNIGGSLGGTSFDFLQLLILLSVITLVPYRYWRMTHRWVGIVFIIASIHFLLVDKPYSLISPMSFYLIFFSIVGFVSYLYCWFPLKQLQQPLEHQVEKIHVMGDVTAVTLMPKTEKFKHKPGQFLFVSFDKPGLETPHPFTISKAATAKGKLRVTAKAIGPFTKILNTLEVGDKATVTGPYGAFLPPNNGRAHIWIAAGIGITPFIAWMDSLYCRRQKVHLYYCVNNTNDVVHLSFIEKLVDKHKQLTFELILAENGHRLTPQKVINDVGDQWPNTDVSFCGPEQMRKQFLDVFTQQGLPKKQFYYEAFMLRSGVGLEKILLWVYEKLLQFIPGKVQIFREKMVILINRLLKTNRSTL